MAHSADSLSHVKIASYNLHGFNQGVGMLLELCTSFDVIFCQELWLSSDQLDKINNLSSDFRCISISAMDTVCGRGVLRGRPFGGLAVMVRNTLSSVWQCLVKSERIVAVKVGKCIFINVYFPVYSSDISYHTEVAIILSTLDSVIADNNDCSIILGGDFNLSFTNGLSRCDEFNKFAQSVNLHLCDTKGDIEYTYCCEARNAKSFIDHFFVSTCISDNIDDYYTIDSGLNFSDHLPLAMQFVPRAGSICKFAVNVPVNSGKSKRLRWDKADLIRTIMLLIAICKLLICRMFWSCVTVSAGCQHEHAGIIDVVYEQIVQSLTSAAYEHCPQTSNGFFKSFWDEEMAELKSKSIETHQLWLTCGRPRQGPIYLSRCRARADYRRALRCKREVAEARISNDLHEQLLSKDHTSFWRTWKNKVSSKRVAAEAVDGYTQPADIANAFAVNFANACTPNSISNNDDLKAEFETRLSHYCPGTSEKFISVELVDKCLSAMKLGKVAGIDNIETEHLRYAHPRLSVLLSVLFNCMMLHGRVPSMFGVGVVVPLIKGQHLDKCMADNYRGITLSPHISKLFEMCILDSYGEYLWSSDLQFGFKKGIGCNHALYTVRSVVEHFTAAGSVVNLCALDMSKAFDKVNHYALWIKLMDRSVPLTFLRTLMHWYGLCSAVVRWENVFSAEYLLQCGVRQGGVLSPVLFAVYVNSLIEMLRQSGYGCFVDSLFVGCVMYADDLLLVSASIHKLQLMVDICCSEAAKLDMKFNASKSQAVRIGRSRRTDICHITLNGCAICFVNELKYLGWYVVSANCFKVSLHHMRVKFFQSFNSIYAKSSHFTEPVIQHLVNTNCKPHLLFGSEVIVWNNSELSNIAYAFNSAMCRIYNVSLKLLPTVYHYTGQTDICNDIVRRRHQFLRKCKLNSNDVIRYIIDRLDRQVFTI